MSTFRSAATEELSGKGIEAVVMVDFPATGTGAAAGSAAIVARCDALFGIYARRFGTRSDDGRSVTEIEYDEATRLGLRCFGFVLDESVEWSTEAAESPRNAEDQKHFVQKVMNDVIVDFFQDERSLRAAISKAADEFLEPGLGEDGDG